MSVTTSPKRIPATTNHEWRDRAACLGMDPELFFPEPVHDGAGRVDERAREACRRCPVKRECGEEQRRTDSLGMWAGTTEAERRSGKRRNVTSEERRHVRALVSATFQQHRDLDAIADRLNREGIKPPRLRARVWTVMDVIEILRAEGVR